MNVNTSVWAERTRRLVCLIVSGGMFIFLCASCKSVSHPRQNVQVKPDEKRFEELENKVDEMYRRLSVIQLNVDTHEKTIKEIESATGRNGDKTSSGGPSLDDPATNKKPDLLVLPGGVTSSELTSQAVTDPVETLYKQALGKYEDSKFDVAETLFRSIVSKYPTHDLANNALYWAGECLYSRKKFKEAIVTFKEVAEKYPGGSKLPDALLKAGYSYVSIGDYENGRLILKKVIKEYPFTAAGEKAEKMLQTIRNK